MVFGMLDEFLETIMLEYAPVVTSLRADRCFAEQIEEPAPAGSTIFPIPGTSPGFIQVREMEPRRHPKFAPVALTTQDASGAVARVVSFIWRTAT